MIRLRLSNSVPLAAELDRAYADLWTMLRRLMDGPKIEDGIVELRMPGGSIFMRSDHVRRIPPQARRIDCSLIVPADRPSASK